MRNDISYKEVVELVSDKLDKINNKLDKFIENNNNSHQKLFEEIAAVNIQATKTNGSVIRLDSVTDKQDIDIMNINKKVTLNTNSRIKRTTMWALAGSVGGAIVIIADILIKLLIK